MSPPELSEPRIGVIACLAEPAALSGLTVPVGAVSIRAAPDEVNLVCAEGEKGAVLQSVSAEIASVDDACLVLDATSGWAPRLLTGGRARDAFAATSANAPDHEGLCVVQGAVCGVPARCLVADGAVLMLVLSSAVSLFDRRRPAEWRTTTTEVEIQRLFAGAPEPV